MPRLHRLAHKALVVQASVECASTARQKHDSALYATRRHNRWRHCDCQPLTSSIVASSCIKVSKQHDYQLGAKAKMFVHPVWKMFTVGYSSWVRQGLLLVNRDRFSSSALGTRLILLIQILYNAVKRLIFFKCDELSKSTAFTFNTLLIFLEYLFEFLINTAPPASDSVYQRNFTAKKL